MNHDFFSGWTTGLGKMKSLSIGTEVCGSILLDLIQFIGLFSLFFQTVWGLNHVDEVFVRIGVIIKNF